MAAVGLVEVERNSNLLLNEENIEFEVTKRMKWSRRTWEEEGETVLNFKKLINSLRYWHKKLANAINDKSLIITLFDVGGEARVNVLEIIDAIIELGYGKEIEGFSDFRNPRYLAFHFKSKKIKELVEKKLRKVGSALVVYLHWASLPEIISVKAHWLPMGHDIKNIKVIIEECIEIMEIKKENITLMSGLDLKRGLLTFCGKLKEGKSVEMLPHITFVDGFECLVTAYGRDPLCLTCNAVGHRSASCPTPFCKFCNNLHAKKDKCSSRNDSSFSYAQILKSDKNDEDITAAAMEGCDQRDVDSASNMKVSKSESLLVNREKERHSNVDNNVSKVDDTTKGGDTYENLDSDLGSSDGEDLLQSKSINFNETLNKMSDYFSELQKFNKTAVLDDQNFTSAKNSKLLNIKVEDTEEMETSDKNLKRKISSSSRGSRGTRRTYSKSNKNTSRTIDVASNLFDVLRDRGDSKK